MIDWSIHYSAFFGSECHIALDRNRGPGYNTLLLRLIPGDLLSAYPQRQFNTLPGLLDSRTALSNYTQYRMRAMQRGSLYHCYDGLWYNPWHTVWEADTLTIKVRGPFVQTLCIEKDSYNGRYLTCKYI